MRALILSDIHGETDALERIVQREDAFDLALVLGDITDIQHDDYVERAEQVLDLVDRAGTFVKAVPGNMDDGRILKLLIERRVNLHKDLFSLQDYDFVGFGGGTTPFNTPFEPDDEERGAVLETLLERTQAAHRAVISHQPPRNTAIDQTADGTQTGSRRLRALLDDNGVDVVFSGHIHEARGTDTVGDTLLVNPGPVKDGHYAVATLAEEIDVDLR